MKARPPEQTFTLIAIALTFASGAMDVASFTRLGGVFTSVMTGNIVLFGLAVARGSVTLASHTAVSVAGYIAGVAGGTLIAYRLRPAGGVDQENQGAREGTLPRHVIWPLLAELILLAGFTVGWEVSGARPAGWGQFCLLAAAAAGMGVQSATVRDMGLAEVSTTYLTGTLTGLVSSLVRPDADTPHGVRRFGVLIGLVTGAVLSGLLLATAGGAVPVPPLAALLFTLALAPGWRWRSRWSSRWPWRPGEHGEPGEHEGHAEPVESGEPGEHAEPGEPGEPGEPDRRSLPASSLHPSSVTPRS